MWKTVLYMMARMFWTFSSPDLGVCHADDVMYLFQMTPIVDLIPTSMDKQVSRDMVRMWTDFARYGNPNGRGEHKWKAAKPDGESDNHYYIISEESRMENLEELQRFQFWK